MKNIFYTIVFSTKLNTELKIRIPYSEKIRNISDLFAISTIELNKKGFTYFKFKRIDNFKSNIIFVNK